jgi:hypothetical protein
MNKFEKGFLVFYVIYITVYIPCYLKFASTNMSVLIPFHLFGMALGIGFLFVVFRDLYKRRFPNPNTKITWTILILMFFPSVLVYLFKYAWKPRIEDVTNNQVEGSS